MIRVAGYCRVSTDGEDQANSFEAQQRYFRDYIAAQPDWQLYDIYADEGISGTATKKRIQFNRMIRDAREGRFTLIITKEVSRFSRNILDTIAYTRELRALGVEVIFLTDGIRTTDPDAELRLSIMGSLAQEESRRTSCRVVWGQTRQMERGVVFGHSLLGYDVKNGEITINPDGARIVRLIFHKYAVGQEGTAQIARDLTHSGFRTYRGSTNWTPAAVIKILHNEKYVGDLIQKKTYTPDYLTHEKRRNTGAVPLIRLENHHEPIISREIWNLAQARLRANNRHKPGQGGHSDQYVFSGRIRCGQCGAAFVVRYKNRKDGTRIRRWCCATAVAEGKAGCPVGKLLRDEDAMDMLKAALNSLSLDQETITQNLTVLVTEAIQADEDSCLENTEMLSRELDRIRHKREAVLDSFFSGDISREDRNRMTQKYDLQMDSLRQKLRRSPNREENQMLEAEISAKIHGILAGERESKIFYRTILQSLTVFQDRHMELRLNQLPRVFRFAEQETGGL